MITLTAQFELLRRARRLALAIQCAGHDWTDEHVEPGKRLRRGDVQCRHCRVIVPLQSAFFYENGVRHGREETLRAASSSPEMSSCAGRRAVPG